jgi:Domain of unknown function (DUF3472)/Domain of unknown function (DUF5077)
MRFILCAASFVAVVAVSSSAGENLKGIACRSVHLGYPAPEGVAFYTDMVVEKSADGTYFMAAGWSKGYFGIQELTNGKKLVLFSVWDPTAGNDPKKVDETKRVKMLHKDEAVRVQRFGGEGTGGQALFDYNWMIGETYRFFVTAKPDGDTRTAYSGYFFVPEKKEWKKLVTFSTITNGTLLKGYYSFVEDFRRNKVSATKQRRATFGNGWVKSVKGDWLPLDKARFTADANPALNIDAGATGGRYFLATGGDTNNITAKLRDTIPRDKERPATKPPADLPKFE